MVANQFVFFAAFRNWLCINIKNMPENDNIQAGGEGADKQPENTESKEVKTGGEDAGGSDDGKDTSEEGKDTAKAPQDTQTVEDDGGEPVVRKRLSAQDFIIGRQRAKLAKSQEKQDDAPENNEDDDDKIAPEDESLITRVVAKQLAPIIDKSLAADDNQEISDFVAENPDFKVYEAKVRRFMTHPSRRNLPIKSIFYEVAGDNLLKMGAERAKAADLKAKDSQTGGGSNRAGEGAKSDWDLPKEEFEAKQQRIREGR